MTLLLILMYTGLHAQQCSLTLSGKVYVSDTAQPYARGASVRLLNMGVLTDSLGNFRVTGLCPGRRRVIISMEGYKTLDTVIDMRGDRSLNLLLASRVEQMSSIVITGNAATPDQITTVIRTTLSGAALEQTRGLTLGETLKSIAGVNSLQMGPSISKPVIHGVYSNRILLMNNGVRQEGQTWGNDHAPEIDPFIATKVTVVKGPGSIRYGSDAIGGVVLLDPKDLPTERGVDGELNLVGMTNGRVGVASGYVEGADHGWSWRAQGTLKEAGNAQTADYYLGNTGFSESDYSATLQYKHANYGASLYYSQFNTRIGIADASVTESANDFETAIARGYPAVNANFSYDVGRPYQGVTHQLFKADGFVDLHAGGRLEATYAYQHDVRKEFEANPPDNADTSLNTINVADITFDLSTYTTDLVWELPVMGKFSGSIGADFITHANLQDHTSYQALIPNFQDYGGGLFAMEKFTSGKWVAEAGVRYDYRWMRAFMLNPVIPTLEEEPTYQWKDPTVNLGVTYTINPHWAVDYNFGTAWRPPQVIELFADGIHQSAASWEIGDSTLTLEQAYNNNLSFTYTSQKFRVEAGGYVNYFHHYIYAQPQLSSYKDSTGQTVYAPSLIQTTQGAFPVFTYVQVNSLFTGLDLDIEWIFLKNLTLVSKTSIVRARNLTIHDWLIDVPADRYDNSIRYELPKLGTLTNAFFRISNIAVSKQFRVPPNSDFAPPPAGYDLWGAEAGCSIPFNVRTIDISLSVTNLLNTAYRDYLNQFRYYVEDLGRNIALRVLVPFDWRKKS